MANKITDEELEELNKKLKEKTTLNINENSYEAMLENLGKEEGYDYLADYDVLKNSRLAQSYSPRTNKVYTYEEAQALTPKQYWEDVMGAANHTDKGTSKEELAKSIGTSTIASAFLGPLATPFVSDSLVKALNTNTGKTLVWGINEGTGGTALYKAIKGEEAVQNKLNQIERVYGNNQLARTTGNVIGNLASYTLGSAAGGLPGAAIAGGISGAGQAYTYSNDPAEIIKGGAVGAVSGLARGATSQAVKSTLARNFPGLIANNYGTVSGMTQNVPGSFAVNAVSSGAGAYAGSAAGGTTGNVINALAGKEVTAEDWKNPFWSVETLTNVAISSLVGGTLGAVGDAKAINQLKADVKSLSSSADSTRKEVYNALKNNDVAKAKTLATSELAKINNVANKEYAGMKLSDNFRLQANAEWYNQMKVMFESFGVPFDQGMLPGSTQLTIGAGAGVIPSGIAQNTSPVDTILPQNYTNNILTNPIKGGKTNGGQLQENNIQGMGEIGRNGTNQLPIESLKKIYERAKANYDKTKGAIPELKKLVLQDLDDEEAKVTSETSREFNTPVYIADLSKFRDGKYGAITTQDGIFIDRQEAKDFGLRNIIYHERGEDLFLNHADVAGAEISNLILKLRKADKESQIGRKLYDKFFNNDDSIVGNRTKGKYLLNSDNFAKEMLFNAYGEEIYKGSDNEYHEIMGDELYNDVIAVLTNLNSIAKDMPKTRIDSLTEEHMQQLLKSGNYIQYEDTLLKPLSANTRNKDVNSPTYIKNSKKAVDKLEEATDNLRNELAKKEDEVQATEMWSKRTERKKLNKKLDTANDKLERTKYNNKQKLQATKEESKEKLSRLTSKKNEEKAQAVKEVKTNATEALKKQKAKDQAILKEAKLDAKATTTKKKFGRANTKLEKALTNVYDKPQSKELDTALEALKKATRGTTKLINKVKTQIPSSMNVVIDDINEILDTYYTGANKMTDEKRASLVKKAEAIEKYAKEHPTVPISKQALNVIKQSTQKSLSDLNPKDLVDLAENVQTIGMDLRDSMSFTRASEDAVKLREEAINFVKGEIAKGGKRTDVPAGKVANTSVEFMRGYHDFNSNITRLITNLSGGNPNSPLYFMDDRLREGTVKYFEFQEKLLSFFEKMVEVQRVPGLGKRVVNKLDYVTNPNNKLKTIVKTSRGENHSLTIADGISIVLGRKDLQFAGHTTGVVTGRFVAPKYKLRKNASAPSEARNISGYKVQDKVPEVSEGGYVILANQADAINGNINKGLRRGVRVKLTNEIVDKLQAELENIPAAKELMDIYSNSGFLKENAKIVNDAYEAITGMSIDERENYFRTVVNPNDRRKAQSQDPTKSADLSARDVLLNTSIVKPVVEGANNSIYIYPIGDVINKMIDDSSIYGAFATELYDIETFLNAADKDGVSLRELIGNLDPDFLTELGQIEDAIIHRRRNTVGANILEKTKNLVGNYSGSILHGNAFLALKQIGSLPTAAPFFQTPTQSILNGVFNKSGIEKMVREYYEGLGEDVSGLSDKEVFDKFFKEATTELETRKRGYTKPTKAEIFKYASPLKRIEAFDWYKSADNWTVNNLAYAMVYDYLTNFGEEVDHEELVRELGNQFIKMHYATQPNTAPYTRTLGQLSDNPLARAALYMADPRLKQANTTFIARQHYKWSKENGTAEEKKKYGREFAEAIVGALSGMTYIILLNEAKSKLKNKDKDKTAKDVVVDVIANTISIYAIGFDMIINRMLSKDYDFDVSIPDTEVINKVYEMYNHGKNLVKHLTNGEENYKYKDVKNIISDLSYITGIPVKNMQDDFMYFLSATDSELYYEMKVKEDTNMYKKYLQFEDRIDDYKEFYNLYKATRESVVKEKYGAYNNKNIKKAIQDADGDVSVYYNVFKLGK